MGDTGSHESFRKSPTQDALLQLLTAHQDSVYTVCFHILRHAQDAEDAAQIALLRVASKAGTLKEPRAFKSWLYRIAFHTAIDHRRTRDARRRAAQERDPKMNPSVSPETHRALCEALASLPDEERLLLAEHYFEKTSLEDIGRREGVSGVAIWKRVEKARERLKKWLLGAGLVLASSQLTHALEAVERVPAPSGLSAAALTSNAALVVAGGAAVGTSKVAGITILLVVLALGGSIGTIAYLRNPQSPAEVAAAPASPPASPSSSPEPKDRGTVIEEKAKTDDVTACRRVLASVLPYVRTTDMLLWGGNVERLHGGTNRRFETFVGEFIESAGPELIPIVKALLAETEADTAKFLLAAVLGRARDPAGLEVLKGLTQGSHYAVAQSALYSIGLIRTPDGLSFLKSTWEQARATKSPVVETTLKAIGLHGAESIPLLLAAAKSNPEALRNKASFLSLVRGQDAVEGLRLVIETETDGSIRNGAAQALALNLDSDHGEAVVELFRKFPEPEIRFGLMYGLLNAWRPSLKEIFRTPARTAVADAILNQTGFPTGSLDVDRALIWLSVVASPEKTTGLLDRFGTVSKESMGPDYARLVREIVSAYSGMPGLEGRLTSLMDSAGIPADQRQKMRTAVDTATSPESTAAAIKANLEMLRASSPGDPRAFKPVDNLVRSAAEDTVLSPALLEVYERCSTSEARFRLMDSLCVALYSNSESVAPRTFLETVLLESAEADVKLLAAYNYLSPGSTRPADPRVLKRIAELIGPGMKWAAESTLGKGEFRMIQVAPSLIGDYYSQFGTSSDIAWLKQLSETFPYPQMLPAQSRELLKRDLEQESRRAIDAIRLRN